MKTLLKHFNLYDFALCLGIAMMIVSAMVFLSSCSRKVDGVLYTKVHSPRGWDYILKADKQAWKEGKSVQHYDWIIEKCNSVAGR